MFSSQHFSTGGDELNQDCYDKDAQRQQELIEQEKMLKQALDTFTQVGFRPSRYYIDFLSFQLSAPCYLPSSRRSFSATFLPSFLPSGSFFSYSFFFSLSHTYFPSLHFGAIRLISSGQSCNQLNAVLRALGWSS